MGPVTSYKWCEVTALYTYIILNIRTYINMYLKNVYAGFFSTPVKPINFWPFIHTGHPCSPSILNGHRLYSLQASVSSSLARMGPWHTCWWAQLLGLFSPVRVARNESLCRKLGTYLFFHVSLVTTRGPTQGITYHK